ncbi:hypothetical protein GMJAKD_04220 [Candidatus Electrothrix aarhusensis]|jgi:hypothetical protein
MRQNTTDVQRPLRKPLSRTKKRGVIFSNNDENNIQSSTKKQGKAKSEKKRLILKNSWL